MTITAANLITLVLISKLDSLSIAIMQIQSSIMTKIEQSNASNITM